VELPPDRASSLLLELGEALCSLASACWTTPRCRERSTAGSRWSFSFLWRIAMVVIAPDRPCGARRPKDPLPAAF